MYVTYLTIYSGEKLPPYYIGSTSIEKIKKGYCGSVVSIQYKKIFDDELKNNKNLFKVFILSEHETRTEAFEMELHLQKSFNVVKSKLFFNESFAVINGCFGRNVNGINNPMFGKKQTEYTKLLIKEKRGHNKRYLLSNEHKKIISKTHKGKIVSEETRKKLSIASKGKVVSEETKRKISDKLKGVNKFNHTEESKRKISDKNKGKIVSKETRKKISETSKGKIISKETRKKISEAKKGKKRCQFSLEWRHNLSLSKKGRIVSKETKEKLSLPRKSVIKICPHCGLIGSGGNMKRYHFENCKLNLYDKNKKR